MTNSMWIALCVLLACTVYGFVYGGWLPLIGMAIGGVVGFLVAMLTDIFDHEGAS